MNTHAKESLPSLIDQAWENRANYSSQNAPAELHAAVAEVIQGLDDGSLRVATSGLKKLFYYLLNYKITKS